MDDSDHIKNRIKRNEGQLREILRMMGENQDCIEVITQLSASRTALDRTIDLIVSSNLIECVRDADKKGKIQMN